jgi:hypothetical protein
MMTSELISPDFINISAEKGVLSSYQFGTMTARHHFCKQCGIHTFVDTRLNPGHYRVNLGCVDELDVLRIPEKIYDGKAL